MEYISTHVLQYTFWSNEQVAGDMLFYHNFDIGQVLDYFRLKV